MMISFDIFVKEKLDTNYSMNLLFKKKHSVF